MKSWIKNSKEPAKALPKADNVQSILINQTKFIGDVVLTSVLVRHLRAEFPNATITMLCQAALAKFVLEQGIADSVVSLDRGKMRGSPFERMSGMSRLLHDLRKSDYDLIIDLSDSKTSRLVMRFVKAPFRVGYVPSEQPLKFWERQSANIFAATYGHGGEHYLHRYLSPLFALGIPVIDPIPSLKPTESGSRQAKQLLARHELERKSFVAVHAGASFPGRCWQPDRFASVLGEIYRRKGLRAVIVGGPDEAGIAGKVLDAATSPIVNLVGQAPLTTLLPLLGEALIFLGNESGPMHLAAAMKTPVVGLFGLTQPDIWGPLGVPNRTLQPPMPCKCIAPGLCKVGNAGGVYCVQRLDAADVTKAAIELIERVS
ncbi:MULTISPECIES: glycosyltransferase family 9 protein [unclassified Mesorhizobium]|uniref:glycosyltransferase family 9 protein n=1 Tax=unclassified Mesorhizobium TaxID=325217 RepID=UPI00112A62B6|nr:MULTISPECIES: glycosyltransferase family 9 protein [unclassified Mesorhizobium]MBZ9808789.1 glycosyltransferase family 9 protein [Mesorhizobium sp. ESP-6-2]TPM32427.1 glycosyltransferase family 9 protein [Mesorhizobium sp. B2-2-2]